MAVDKRTASRTSFSLRLTNYVPKARMYLATDLSVRDDDIKHITQDWDSIPPIKV